MAGWHSSNECERRTRKRQTKNKEDQTKLQNLLNKKGLHWHSTASSTPWLSMQKERTNKVSCSCDTSIQAWFCRMLRTSAAPKWLSLARHFMGHFFQSQGFLSIRLHAGLFAELLGMHWWQSRTLHDWPYIRCYFCTLFVWHLGIENSENRGFYLRWARL